MNVLTILFAATQLAIIPADRMAMADRLFDRARYADARAEYIALKGADGIKSEDLLYRLAECERALGNKEEARRSYSELLEKHPLFKYANRARLQKALLGNDIEKKAELKLLDADNVDGETRAAALYYLGIADNDPALLSRCVRTAPRGRYADYAKLRHAAMTVGSDDPTISRTAIRELLEIHYTKKDSVGKEALYLAATQSYRLKRYGEAMQLFKMYLKAYPEDATAADARTMAAWSAYMTKKFAEAAQLCGEGGTDDTAYLKSMCAYSTGDMEEARKLMKAYLESWPEGKYRQSVELPLARMAFQDAEKSDNLENSIEAAKRSVALSNASGDRLRLAWAFEKADREAEAMAEYDAVAKEYSGTDDAAEALYRSAMIDLRLRRWSSAELKLAEALSSGKNQRRKASSLYWRGIAAVNLDHEAEGIEHLQEALKLGLGLDESREARLIMADADFKAGKTREAKTAYAQLVREGATARMSAAKKCSVGRFLLECKLGDEAIDEAKMCARSLIDDDGVTAQWKQEGYALLGKAAETQEEYTLAMDAYKKAMSIDARTEDMKSVSLALGILESKSGEHGEADKHLKEAISLNSGDAAVRAKAYLALARNCEAMTDYHGAIGYSTVVISLFDDPETAKEAQKIIDGHSQEVAQ